VRGREFKVLVMSFETNTKSKMQLKSDFRFKSLFELLKSR